MPRSSEPKVLVTGAKGVLGADLCPIFAEKCRVIAKDVEEMGVRDAGCGNGNISVPLANLG